MGKVRTEKLGGLAHFGGHNHQMDDEHLPRELVLNILSFVSHKRARLVSKWACNILDAEKRCLRLLSHYSPCARRPFCWDGDYDCTCMMHIRSFLSKLTRLQDLEVDPRSFYNLRNLEYVASLTSLQHLRLCETNTTSLGPLSGLTRLQHLDLRFTRVTDLTPLSMLTSLQVLWLADTRVSNLEPIAGLTSLRELSVCLCGIRNLTPLSDLTSLQILNIEYTNVPDLKPLSGLTNLRRLDMWVRYCRHNLQPLFNLASLRYLNINKKTISYDDYREISQRKGLVVTHYGKENEVGVW